MAVEIPVVVDIEKAFEDASARIGTAMRPFKQTLEREMAGLKLNIQPKGVEPEFRSLESILKNVREYIGDTNFAFEHLTTALGNAKTRLSELYAIGTKNGGLTGSQRILVSELTEAIALMEREVDLRTRAGNLASEEARRQIAVTHAIQEGNTALSREASTMAEMTAKISALRGKLLNINPEKNADEWKATAKEIKTATAQLEKYKEKLDAILNGSKSSRTSAGSIDRLSKEMQKLITKWNSMSKSVKFDPDGRLSAKAKELVQQYRELTAESERYGRSLQATAQKAIPSVETLSQKLNAQSGILRMLTSYMSVYMAIFAGIRFIRNIRETTAEFEMQRVALGGIIQDADRANSLFREIKAAAIESPFQIKQLVTYTKQLSAYQIETEKLFDTTMKLADVSAGLGVDMNRLILAYGQVRAAAVLRGQELRQFTEAGIPLVEKLAEKFRELGREGTTTADVFELISKRAVPFEMVASIFDDMTERGGIFYKMQEKQAETLKGQWNNLKDSLSIMYDEIGNTSAVHGAMSGLINDAKFLFQNWRYVANAIKISAGSFLLFKAASLFLPNLKRELILSKKAQDAFTRSTELATFAQQTGSKAAMAASIRLKGYARAMELAALETNFFKRTWLKLKAVMATTNWISLVVTALSVLATVFASIALESGRLNKELRKIGVEGQTSINRSIANFQRLADVATSAADGSKEQADAVAELKRTYGDIIPTQELEADKLKELKGDYEALTVAIRQKISEQIREQKVNAITDEYSKTLQRKQKKAKDLLSSYGLDKDQINAIMSEIQEAVQKGMISIESTAYERRQAYQNIIKDLTGFVVDLGSGFRDLSGRWQNVSDLGDTEEALNKLTNSYIKMEGAIRDVDNSMETQIGTFGKFAKMAKDMEKDVANVFVGPEFGDPSSYAAKQQKIKQTVAVYWDYIQKAFEEASKTSKNDIDISKALLGDGKIDFSFIDQAVKDAMEGGKNTRLNTFINTIQQGYDKLVPSDRVVNLVREKVRQIADQFGVPMDKAQIYFKDSQTSMEDWVKNLEEAQKEHASIAAQMALNNAEIAAGTKVLEAFSDAEVAAENNMANFLQTLIDFFGEFKKHQNAGAYKQDPFIGQMQERMKFMQDFKKSYDDLSKYISSDSAMSKVSENLVARGLALGLDADQQRKAAKELSQWYGEAMDEAFKAAKKYGASGSIQEFLSKPITDTSNRGKALKEFQKLIQSLFDAKTDIDISNLKKEFDDALSKLEDELKRSETARNFFQDIFDLTGDRQLATDMAISVYGDPGADLGERIRKSIEGAMESLSIDEKAGIGEDMMKALNSMDFRTLMDNLDKLPEKLQKPVKEAAAATEKYNADVSKSYIKLLNKFDEMEQQRVNIERQADKDIADLREGLALEIKGINEDSSIQDKEAAVKAAEDRADAVERGIEREKKFQLSRLTRDYRLFFSSVGVISDEAARKVARNQKEMLTEQFNAGQKTLAQYKRELREIDEQLNKYTTNKSMFASYLSGGVDGLSSKLKEYSDSLLAIADASFNKKDGSWLMNDDDKAYIDKLGSIFGGKIFGVSGRKDVFSKLFQLHGNDAEEFKKALEGAADSIGEIGANFSAGVGIADLWVKNIGNLIIEVDKLGNQGKETSLWWDSLANMIMKIPTLGLSKSDSAGDRLAEMNQYAMEGFEKFKSGNFIGAFADTIRSWGAMFGPSVKAIDREIKKQDQLVDELEYSYNRLDVAMEKAFGSEYIYNYGKQLEVLQAKAEAYQKQAELEESKGKKADDDKIEEYKKKAREIQDQMEDMKTQLAEFFAGTDITSAAEEFATAWIDAYKEFGSTTDAMSEKFNDMIESMINRSLAAKIMQEMLQPIFDQIDTMARDGLLSTDEISTIAELAQSRIPLINDAMTNLMSSLAAAGLDVRTSTEGLKGISRNIANASEESILGLAAAVNTQNFYMSYVPVISETVTAILTAMTGGTVQTAGPATDENGDVMPSVQKMIYDHLPNMDQNIGEMLRLFKSVVTTKNGSTNTNYVAVK